MRQILLYLCVSCLISACSERDSELTLSSLNGTAFINSKVTLSVPDSSIGVEGAVYDVTKDFYDECISHPLPESSKNEVRIK